MKKVKPIFILELICLDSKKLRLGVCGGQQSLTNQFKDKEVILPVQIKSYRNGWNESEFQISATHLLITQVRSCVGINDNVGLDKCASVHLGYLCIETVQVHNHYIERDIDEITDIVKDHLSEIRKIPITLSETLTTSEQDTRFMENNLEDFLIKIDWNKLLSNKLCQNESFVDLFLLCFQTTEQTNILKCGWYAQYEFFDWCKSGSNVIVCWLMRVSVKNGYLIIRQSQLQQVLSNKAIAQKMDSAYLCCLCLNFSMDSELSLWNLLRVVHNQV
ncbi:hypothetical protein RFI_05246 [Reticulomyxa filosa]|uniref:Uncharacterized protein n=1 Tax=Reticulomyxa filosa TaxID=46433 RepID=X6NZZ6_RETFI|nr:hypothetical protein RFI_05246 [Reticulomyxa filosa]|eukprot:ETO31870.1 hypothetical protein RFI_05246 [Reticulomyxa filosa]